MTRRELRDQIKRRLGIEADIPLNQIWTDAELNSYIQEAYLRFARESRLLFSMDTIKGLDSTATYTIPSDVVQLERALWDGNRIPPSTSRDLRKNLATYRSSEGEPFTYCLDEDGPSTIRLANIPSADGSAFTIVGTWGALRTPTDITAATITGTWGVPRILPGHHPTRGAWGIPRIVAEDTDNLRIEGYRQGLPVTQDSHSFELPDQWCRYLRWFVLAKAYKRDGPGQDLQLAQHFEERWAMSLERVAFRRRQMVRERVGVLGKGASTMRQSVAPPRLPWNYPQYPSRR